MLRLMNLEEPRPELFIYRKPDMLNDILFCAVSSTSSVQLDFMSSERLMKMRDDLRFSLIRKYGPSRAKTLYEKHVKQCHYLIINAEEDDEMAALVRKLLEDHRDSPTIKGRWNIVLGSQRLAVWQQLIQSATTILVFLSRALCKDEILSFTFPGILTQDRIIVPIYLEEFTLQECEKEFLSNLRPVVYSYGTTLYDRSTEGIKEFVDNLHSKFSFVKHYYKEVKALQDLLMPTDLFNICPCGEC
ncbi:uncharacterized protein LOC135210916 isoform X2 [Macrobrachium nipponense]|uniref:uncharacterized protein LOC135210916 isoform X2 n=1 Tax=Macrobrachium nipponense TaxID=159736 RepID=UPI0030C8D2DB